MKSVIRAVLALNIIAYSPFIKAKIAEEQKSERKSQFEPQGDYHKRAIFWPAFVSLLLPGFDQYWEGQYAYAASYTGLYLVGAGMSAENMKQYREYDEKKNRGEKDERLRNDYEYGYGRLGSVMVNTSSFLSAYHSFKTAVRTRPADFPFIAEEESIQDLLYAPFDFSQLQKPSTYILLGGIAGGMLVMSRLMEKKEYSISKMERMITACGVSYGAGVAEEAAFRGWMLPALHYGFDNAQLANVTQSAIFGLAHYSPGNGTPIVQTALGAYWGWLVQQNGYSLKETIFQHFWWDTIILGSSALMNATQHTKLPLYVPALSIAL